MTESTRRTRWESHHGRHRRSADGFLIEEGATYWSNDLLEVVVAKLAGEWDDGWHGTTGGSFDGSRLAVRTRGLRGDPWGPEAGAPIGFRVLRGLGQGAFVADRCATLQEAELRASRMAVWCGGARVENDRGDVLAEFGGE